MIISPNCIKRTECLCLCLCFCLSAHRHTHGDKGQIHFQQSKIQEKNQVLFFAKEFIIRELPVKLKSIFGTIRLPRQPKTDIEGEEERQLTWRASKDMRRMTENLKKLGLEIVKSKLSLLKRGAITVDRLQRREHGYREPIVLLRHLIVIVEPTRRFVPTPDGQILLKSLFLCISRILAFLWAFRFKRRR